jgi:hypothetical protein
MYDPRATTKNARKAFLDSFERQVDPHGLLPIDERRRRATYAKKAHFARLARLSALARTRRRQGLRALGPLARPSSSRPVPVANPRVDAADGELSAQSVTRPLLAP